jgi:GAF domain-containing protein
MTNPRIVAETVGKFQEILDKLRKDTNAGRTTVRVDHQALGFELNTPATESLAEGVHSIKPHSTFDQWNARGIQWMVRTKRTFVMNDCLDPWDPGVAPEREVVETYGIRSEMIAPLIRSGDMIGWVSVHYTKGPRIWTKDEINMIEAAADRVRSVLEDVDAVSSGD